MESHRKQERDSREVQSRPKETTVQDQALHLFRNWRTGQRTGQIMEHSVIGPDPQDWGGDLP